MKKKKCVRCYKPLTAEEKISHVCVNCKDCFRWYSSEKGLRNHNCVPITCSVCDLVCQDKSALKYHMRTHLATNLTDKRFECVICNKKYTKREALNLHTRMFHDKAIRCEKCKGTFDTQEDFDHHLVDGCLLCEKCRKYFPSSEDLKDHECDSRICDVCRKVFSSQRLLTLHMSSHSKIKPFKCEMCEKSYKTIQFLKSHMLKHSSTKLPEKRFQCDICNTKFQSIDSLNYHNRKFHDKLRCQKCKRKFDNQEDFDHHLVDGCLLCQKCRKYFPSSEDLKDHECKPKMCDICGKKIAQQQSLANHMATHSNAKPFKCDKCKKSFKTNRGLKCHVALAHKIDKVRCERCKTMFDSQEDIDIHLVDGCKFCEKCSGYFPSSDDLKEHKCKPIKCGVCGDILDNKSQMASNMLVYSKDQPLQCTSCKQRDQTSGALTKITRKRHRIIVENLPCQHCSATFESVESLAEHVKSHYRCTCGRQFRNNKEILHHKSYCGRKCKYCGNKFFNKLQLLVNHEIHCKKRQDFQCSHCDTGFEEKALYKKHVSSFCSQRKVWFKCYCWNFGASGKAATQGFESDNALAILEHVITCKPQFKHKYLACFICDVKVPSESASYHAQFELLHSRLFRDIPCIFKCKLCTIGFPTQRLLGLHNEMEHPCLVKVINEWNDDLMDLTEINVPAEKSKLLQMERQRIRKIGLEGFEFEGKVPLFKCNICLHPFHSSFIKDSHVRICQNKYRVATHGTDYQETISKATKTKLIRTDLTPVFAMQLYERLLHDMAENANFVARWDYCIELEREFKIARGLGPKLIAKALKYNSGASEFFQKTLAQPDIVVIGEVQVKVEPMEIDLTEDDVPGIPVAVPERVLICRTCGKICESVAELSRHKNAASVYFKIISGRSKKKPRKVPVSIEAEPTDYEDLSLWTFNGSDPKYFCEKCWHPYHSKFIKECHQRICKVDKGSPDCCEEEMEVQEKPLAKATRVLTIPISSGTNARKRAHYDASEKVKNVKRLRTTLPKPKFGEHERFRDGLGMDETPKEKSKRKKKNAKK